MEWEEYEQVTKNIYETLGKGSGVSIECHGKNCKVTGKSGVEHQIDVLTNHSDGIHIYKTGIECKYWDKTVNKDIIMKVAEVIEDAGINKGVIVSKKGFTVDAIAFAKYRNIGLVELREIEDKDWEGRIQTIVLTMNMLLPTITDFQVVISEPNPTFNPTKAPINFYEIEYSTGETESVEKYVKEFNAELCKKEEDEMFEKNYTLKAGAVLKYKPTSNKIPITGLKLSGILKIAKETIEIKGEEHIWLIMKSVFENKRYTISKNGEIIEKE